MTTAQPALMNPPRPGTEDASPAIAVRALTHRYPPARARKSTRKPATIHPDAARAADGLALDAVSFTVPAGAFFGFLGPNGSGKSTLFRILATLMTPTAGSARIFGHDVIADSAAVRAQLGVVFQHPSLDAKLTARENLTHHGHLYGLRGADLRQRIDAALQQVHLDDRADHFAETFSGGMQRRLEIAKALLPRPRLLLLDEPSTGLDVGARRELWRLLGQLRQSTGVTLALTTHLMEEAEHCDQLAILANGRLAALDTPDNLKRLVGGDVLTIDPAPGEDPAALVALLTERLGPWGEDAAPRVVERMIHLEHADGAELVARVGALLGTRCRRISVGRPTLEDVFVHLTGLTLHESGGHG